MPLTIYTVKEACKELADRDWEITDKGLRKAMDRGELLYKKIGNTYVITKDDLEEYFQRGRPHRGRRPK
jgi:hypothetical protein